MIKFLEINEWLANFDLSGRRRETRWVPIHKTVVASHYVLFDMTSWLRNGDVIVRKEDRLLIYPTLPDTPLSFPGLFVTKEDYDLVEDGDLFGLASIHFFNS